MSADVTKPPIAERVKLARKARGWSQKVLGQRVGMTQTGIGEIENGRSERPSKLRELARELGRTEAWLLGELPLEVEKTTSQPPASNASPPFEVAVPKGRLPVLGQAQGGSEGRMIMTAQRVAEAFCPPNLEGVEGAYAVFVHGTSMEDRFRAGDTVWAHPHQAPRQDDDVIIQIAGDSPGDLPSGYVKRFVSRSDRELVVRQLKPPEGADEIMRFPSDRVISVHKIVFVAPA